MRPKTLMKLRTLNSLVLKGLFHVWKEFPYLFWSLHPYLYSYSSILPTVGGGEVILHSQHQGH